MHYWRIRIRQARDCYYDVYYKNEIPYANVAKQAVIDDDLLDVHLRLVEFVEPINEEIYHEFMYS